MLREMSIRAIKVIIPKVQAPFPAQAFLKLQAVRSRRGCREVCIFALFLPNFPRQTAWPALGTRTASVPLRGCSLQLLSWSYSKKGEIKVWRRSARNIHLFSHTSSSGLTSKKKLLRSIYLINVFQQSTCPLGHHPLEVVSGFVVFIIFFPQTSHKVSGNSCWLKRWSRASVSTKRSGYTA